MSDAASTRAAPASPLALIHGRGALARRGLAFDAAGTFTLNAATLVLALAATTLLSRLLGARGYGAYAFAFAWATILTVPAALGLAPLLVRNVAAYHARKSWTLLHGILRRSNQAVVASSIALMVGGAVVGLVLERSRPELLHPYLVGLLLVPLISITSLRQAVMQGLGRVVLGRLPETVLAPLLFVVLIGCLALVAHVTATLSIALQVASMAIAFVVGTMLLYRSLPGEVRRVRPEYATRGWARSAVPFLLMGGVGALNAQVGTIALGAIKGADAAGVYGVASKVGLFTSFLWLCANYPLMPAAARLHATTDRAAFERLLVRFGRATLLATLPVFVALVAFAAPLLSLFGHDFSSGATALRVIALGELCKVLTGFTGLALVMTRYEDAATVALVIGGAVTLVLSFVLTPVLGVNGAAIAAASGAALAAVIGARMASRKLGMRLLPVALPTAHAS